MKIKFLAITSVLILSGCATSYGDTVSASEIGKVREAADAKVYQGDMNWKNGTGLVYQRQNNQCGKNCANHAELALKMDQERAQAKPNADYLRAVKRTKDGERNQRIAKICRKGVMSKFGKEKETLEAKKPRMSNFNSYINFDQAHSSWLQAYERLELKMLKTENQCNEAGRNDPSFN